MPSNGFGLIPVKTEGKSYCYDPEPYLLLPEEWWPPKKPLWPEVKKCLDEQSKPPHKLTLKTLAYLSPLLVLFGLIKNPELGRREFCNPVRWFR